MKISPAANEFFERGTRTGKKPVSIAPDHAHYHFRQQEGNEFARKSRLDAAEREAEVAARHMRDLEISERRFHSAFTHASIGMALVSFDDRFCRKPVMG